MSSFWFSAKQLIKYLECGLFSLSAASGSIVLAASQFLLLVFLLFVVGLLFGSFVCLFISFIQFFCYGKLALHKTLRAKSNRGSTPRPSLVLWEEHLWEEQREALVVLQPWARVCTCKVLLSVNESSVSLGKEKERTRSLIN